MHHMGDTRRLGISVLFGGVSKFPKAIVCPVWVWAGPLLCVCEPWLRAVDLVRGLAHSTLCWVS
eukprot:scaffold1553_cov132-Isochrysis_galbana.AAC.9